MVIDVVRKVGILSALVLVLLALTPPEWVAAGPRWCPVRAVLGHDCYGCGMTRAFAYLLHGDGATAQAYNRGAVFVLPMVAVLAIFGCVHR